MLAPGAPSQNDESLPANLLAALGAESARCKSRSAQSKELHWRRATKPSSSYSGSKRQIGSFGSASLSRAFNFFDSDGQGISLRIGAATHYSFPARLAAPSLGLACQRRKGNVMTKKIAEIKTTIRTTTPYTGTL